MSNIRHLKLFVQVPIGGLFFREPGTLSLPSIKIEDGRARTPRGKIIDVHPHVLVFTNAVRDDWLIEPVFYEETPDGEYDAWLESLFLSPDWLETNGE